MNIRTISLLLIAANLLSCTEERTDSLLLESSESSSQTKICLDKTIEGEESDLAQKAIVNSKRWDVGETITVQFLGGSTSLQNRIFAVAEIWEDYANVNFERVNSNGDIRIAINNSGSSWSYIGTDARRINSNNQTMNFGWFTDNSSDIEILRTTLHEFGHALGAIHEHSSPANTIQWDREAVYETYARQGWSRATVDNNLFAVYGSSLVSNSQYDPLSIMHYPISNNLTLNNFSVGWNFELSDVDKSFIGEIYPFDGDRPSSGENIALGRSTSQSSLAYNGSSSRAVDGNTNGRWGASSVTHTATTNRPWWKVDLDSQTSIGRIVIYNRTDNCCIDRLSNFSVDILNNSGNVVQTYNYSNAPTPSLTINVNGVTGRSVRVRLNGTNPLSLSEVEVYAN